MTTQPDQRLTAEEQEIVAALERSRGRPLTPEEINLSLEQARALGQIADNVVPIKRGAARSRSLSPPRGVGRDCLHPAAGLCGLNPGGLASGVFPRQTSLPSAIGIAPMASTLSGKTLFITGASRGIGLAIGLKAARDGANVVIAAKTAEPHPKLPGTIFSAAAEIEKAGGKALPLTVDVRDEAQVRAALDKTVAMFGGVDIVVNNASAISLTNSQATDMKRFDLMHQINARGTFMVSKFAVPFLEKSDNPHILMLSPPLDLKEKWFSGSTAYTMAKYGMSLVVLGLAGELRPKGIAVNALWPRTTIATAAIKYVRGEAIMRASRTPDILADAAHMIFLKDAKSLSGNYLIDDTYLFENGVRDFDQYRVDPSVDLEPDFFVPDNSAPPVSLAKAL